MINFASVVAIGRVAPIDEKDLNWPLRRRLLYFELIVGSHYKEETMSLSPSVQGAIQSAGSAIFNADVELKIALKAYASQVELAMANNPFDVGNDALFEEWKTVARLSQSVTQIEQELRQIFDIACSLSINKRDVAISHSRVRELPAPLVNQVIATDVIAKSPRGRLKGNALKVLGALLPLLNDNEFRKVNQSAVAQTAAVPQGSLGATLKRLATNGYIVAGSKGQFKLPAA